MFLDGLDFDLRKAAELHSQLMGVLAGFSVLVLANLLSAPTDSSHRRDRSIDACVTALVATLVMLIAAAFLYANAAAEKEISSRAGLTVLLSGIDAAFGVLTMFYALTLLANRAEYRLGADTLARVTASGVATAAILYLIVSALNTMVIVHGSNARLGPWAFVLYADGGAGLCVAVVIQAIWEWRPLVSVVSKVEATIRPERWLPAVAVLAAALTAVAYGALLPLGPDVRFPDAALAGIVVLGTLYALLMMGLVRAVIVSTHNDQPKPAASHSRARPRS